MAQVAKWWEAQTRRPSAPAVFVSHASVDHAIAAQVVDALESAGLPCWIAPRDIPPGRSWATAIVGGIDSCRVLIVLMTERSVESAEVQREVELAANGGKHLLTVRLDVRAQLSGPLTYFLAPIQWIEASGRPLGPHLTPLLSAIQGFLGRPSATIQRRTTPRRGRDEDDGRGGRDLDDLLRRTPRKR